MASPSNNDSTKVLAIIGDPVKQVKSPATFGEYFKAHGINAVMVPLHVSGNDFRRALEGLRVVKNFAGAVVTIPHKHAAYKAARARSPMARRTGAANVLAPTGKEWWSADMLDGVGLIHALHKRAITVAGLRALLVGAGGAGTAIGVALEQLGHVASISIVEPDRKRAEMLEARLEHGEIVEADPGGYQLVVNASPVGMGSFGCPLDTSRLTPGTIVCDAIMDPPKTRLLQEAGHRGCTIVQGIEMLLGQVEPIVHFFGLQSRKNPAG